MRINLALILSIIVAVGVVALVFTAFQISSEKQKLNNELQSKTVRLAEDFYKTYFRHLEDRDSVPLRGITDSVINQYSFIGLAVYYNRDSIIPLNSSTQLLFNIHLIILQARSQLTHPWVIWSDQREKNLMNISG